MSEKNYFLGLSTSVAQACSNDVTLMAFRPSCAMDDHKFSSKIIQSSVNACFRSAKLADSALPWARLKGCGNTIRQVAQIADCDVACSVCDRHQNAAAT